MNRTLAAVFRAVSAIFKLELEVEYMWFGGKFCTWAIYYAHDKSNVRCLDTQTFFITSPS